MSQLLGDREEPWEVRQRRLAVMSHEVGYTSAAGSFAWRVSEGGGARTAFGAGVGSWRVRAGRGVVCSVPSAAAVERPGRRPLAVHAAAVVGDHLRAPSCALPAGQFLVRAPCRRVTGVGGGHHSGPGRERGPAGRVEFLAEEIPNYGERHRCGEPISRSRSPWGRRPGRGRGDPAGRRPRRPDPARPTARRSCPAGASARRPRRARAGHGVPVPVQAPDADLGFDAHAAEVVRVHAADDRDSRPAFEASPVIDAA